MKVLERREDARTAPKEEVQSWVDRMIERRLRASTQKSFLLCEETKKATKKS